MIDKMTWEVPSGVRLRGAEALRERGCNVEALKPALNQCLTHYQAISTEYGTARVQYRNWSEANERSPKRIILNGFDVGSHRRMEALLETLFRKYERNKFKAKKIELAVDLRVHPDVLQAHVALVSAKKWRTIEPSSMRQRVMFSKRLTLIDGGPHSLQLKTYDKARERAIKGSATDEEVGPLARLELSVGPKHDLIRNLTVGNLQEWVTEAKAFRSLRWAALPMGKERLGTLDPTNILLKGVEGIVSSTPGFRAESVIRALEKIPQRELGKAVRDLRDICDSEEHIIPRIESMFKTSVARFFRAEVDGPQPILAFDLNGSPVARLDRLTLASVEEE